NTMALPSRSIRQTRCLSVMKSKLVQATTPLGSPNPVAKGTALLPSMRSTRPPSSLPGSAATVTYTLASNPTVTAVGFFNPLNQGSGGFVATADTGMMPSQTPANQTTGFKIVPPGNWAVARPSDNGQRSVKSLSYSEFGYPTVIYGRI